MSAFGMQVGCGCGDAPAAMECVNTWDGPDTGVLVEGRRYIWECSVCGHQVCVNMKLVDPNACQMCNLWI